MSDLIYLFESTPLDSAGVVKTINFSRGLLSEDDLGGAPYPVRLETAFTHETSVFESNIPGNTSISVGSSTINNADGRFDFLLDYKWDARPVTIKRGSRGAAYATYTTEFVGSILELTTDQRSLIFTLRDNSYKLIKPLQPTKFIGGGGGSEGGLDLRNKTKPLLFGKARNLAPVWLDSALLTGQFHDGAVTSVQAMYDRANPLSFFADYATYALLVAAKIPSGSYGTCLAQGFVRLGAPPAGAVTMDAVGQYGAVANLPELARQVLTTRGGLVAGDLNTASFTQASTDVAYPFEGIYFQEPDFQVDEFLETIASAINGYWYVSKTGLITIGQFKFRTPVAIIRAEDTVSLGRLSSPPPLHRIKVNYAKNPTILGPSEFIIPREGLNGWLKDDILYVVTDAVGAGGVYNTYVGEFEVYLNDTKVNTLDAVQFSEINVVPWLTITPTGTFTITDPGVDSASVTLEARMGEFYIRENFVLKKAKGAALGRMDLVSDRRRFAFDDTGSLLPAGQVANLTAGGANLTALTWSAIDNLNNTVTMTGSGSTRSIAGTAIANSPLVEWVRVIATDTNGVNDTVKIVVQQGESALGASVLGALAAANATIDIYYQTEPPTGAKSDDLWYDTNDSNKVYRWNGITWALLADTRIADALSNAATAQGTADGRVRTYFSESVPAPTPVPALGDLWYQPSTRILKRWNSTTWVGVSTVGAVIGDNLIDNTGTIITRPQILNSEDSYAPRLTYDFGNGAQGWASLSQTQSVAAGILTSTSNAADPAFRSPAISITGSLNYIIRARVRLVSGTPNWDGAMFFTTSGHPESLSFYKYATPPAGWLLNEWCVVEWDMRTLTAGGADYNNNIITGIRFDLYGNTGVTAEVDWVTIGDLSGDVLIARGVQDNATLGAIWGGVGANLSARPTNLSALVGTEGIQNSLVSIGAGGALVGAGTGQVTIAGLGYTGALNATFGARLGLNLLAEDGSTGLTDYEIRNSRIRIGGGNILKKSNMPSGAIVTDPLASSLWAIEINYTGGTTSVSSTALNIEPNTEYTISLFAVIITGASPQSFILDLFPDELPQSPDINTVTPARTKFTWTFTTGAQASLSTALFRIIRQAGLGNGGIVRFYDIMIERANRASDWSPAPDDVEVVRRAGYSGELNATLGAIWGGVGANLSARPTNLAALGGTEGINNAILSIGSNGAFNGGGGGQVTIGGLGYVGALNATFGARIGTLYADDGITVLSNDDVRNNALAVEAYDSAGTQRLRLRRGAATTYSDISGGVSFGATVGAIWGGVGANLSARPTNLSALVGTEGIQNSLLTIGVNGALGGGGSGQVTIGGLTPNGIDDVGEGVSFKKYPVGDKTKVATVETSATRNVDGANMIPSPILFDRAELGGSGTSLSTSVTTGRPLHYKRAVLSTDNAYVVFEQSTTKMPCVPGERLYLSYAAATDASGPTTDTVIAVLQFFDQAGTYITGFADEASRLSGNQIAAAAGSIAVGKGSILVPAAVSYVRLYVVRNGAGNGGYFIVAEPYLGRAEQGADITSGITGEAGFDIQFDHTGAAKDGQLPRLLNYKLFRNGVQVTSGVTWSVAVINGSGTASISGTGTGTLSVNTLPTTTNFRITALHVGTTRVWDVNATRVVDAAPSPSGVATTVAFNSITSQVGASYGAANTPIGRVKTGVNGGIRYVLNTDFYISGSVAGTAGIFAKFLVAAIGGGYGDAFGEQASQTSATNTTIAGEPTDHSPGAISFSIVQGGLAGNTEYDVYLDIRSSGSTWTLTFTGTASASGV